jgi:hypothetical protein
MTDIDPHDWGKVILEELLFRAARDLAGPGHGTVTVSLEFHLTPNQAAPGIDISIEGAVEPLLRTTVPLP